MSWSSVARFSDLEACRHAIQGVAGFELFPTSTGNFNTEVTRARFDRVWMQRFEFALPQIITCEYRPDRQAITFITETKSPDSSYCGVDFHAGEMIVSRGESVVHWKSDANYRAGAMSLPKDELHSTFNALVGYDFRDRNDARIIRPDAASMARLLKVHKAVGKLARDNAGVLELPEVSRALDQKLIHLMVRCLAGDALEFPTVSFRHHATMAKFEELLEANSGRPLYVSEVCAALGVAERTLRSCCEENLGMGPIRYLTMRRMHLVYRALRRAEPSRTTVTQIVTDHGFWELGRFSVAYRALFGESPSDTLRRPADPAEFTFDRPSSLVFTEPSGRLH